MLAQRAIWYGFCVRVMLGPCSASDLNVLCAHCSYLQFASQILLFLGSKSSTNCFFIGMDVFVYMVNNYWSLTVFWGTVVVVSVHTVSVFSTVFSFSLPGLGN